MVKFMKICIVKLGAMGDVVRTLPIAKVLKNKYPNSKITWVTRMNIKNLFEGIDYVDKVITLPHEDFEKFDLLYNFDIDDEATGLALTIKADKKYGFFSEDGYAASFNPGAEYYINTIFDDLLKKKNKRTYQDMMFEAAELSYNKEDYEIVLSEKEKKFGRDFLERNDLKGKRIIGIHLGASGRWPSKVWDEDNVKGFIKLAKEKGYEILLFGGPNEAERQKNFYEELKNNKIKIFLNNPNNNLREFFSLVNICGSMVCSDSLALHVALGLKKKTAGLFLYLQISSKFQKQYYLKKRRNLGGIFLRGMI